MTPGSDLGEAEESLQEAEEPSENGFSDTIPADTQGMLYIIQTFNDPFSNHMISVVPVPVPVGVVTLVEDPQLQGASLHRVEIQL